MNISGIVTQLETVEGLNGKVVVGLPPETASLSNGPAVWITDLAETAGANPRVNKPAIQRIEVRLGLVMGTATLDDLLPLRDAVRDAIIDYQPESNGDPITYRAGRMEFLDAGYTVWRDEYAYSFYFDHLEAT
ncbi:MAG: hypothetical protein RLZZ09_1533 [Pseudomonadota bacterium]|jgi:hypothetical protein